jgi:hypothetical protein
MGFHMLGEIVGSRKVLVAFREGARKRSFQSVDSHMSFQVFQALEAALALGHRAYMGFVLLLSIIRRIAV